MGILPFVCEWVALPIATGIEAADGAEVSVCNGAIVVFVVFLVVCFLINEVAAGSYEV